MVANKSLSQEHNSASHIGPLSNPVEMFVCLFVCFNLGHHLGKQMLHQVANNVSHLIGPQSTLFLRGMSETPITASCLSWKLMDDLS